MVLLLSVVTSGQTAGAAPGDISHAEGEFLSGTLLASDLALVAELESETASSDGTSSEENQGNLDLTALGAINIAVPGGVQVPLDLTDAGVVGQYASALDESSLGSSGAIQSDGTIGTGGTPAPGVAPGPLSLDLSDLVSDLGLDPDLLSEVAELSLEIDGVSAQASQEVPNAPVGDYSIDDVKMDFQSTTVAALMSDVDAAVAIAQDEIDDLPSGVHTALTDAFGPLTGALSVNANVGNPDLAAVVSGMTSGTLADPGAYPGVTVDLDTGVISLDLDEFTSLNGLAPDTDILTNATINTIAAYITGLLEVHLLDIQNALLDEVDAISITAGVTLAGLDILDLDTTVWAIRAHDPTGIELLGAGLTLPGGANTVSGALLSHVILSINTLPTFSDDVMVPVVHDFVPALKPVLNEVVGLTVNNQSGDSGVFSETALRVTLLPAADALTLDVATARVGPNALALAPAPSVTGIDPDEGPVAGGQTVTITGDGFVQGTTEVVTDGDAIAAGDVTVIDGQTLTYVTPAHAEEDVFVYVRHGADRSTSLDYTYVDAGDAPTAISMNPDEGPITGGQTVTITGTDFVSGETTVDIDGTVIPTGQVSVLSGSTLTFVTPPHAVGFVDVFVTTPAGDSAPLDYFYIADPVDDPVVDSLTPDNGPVAGGTVVTITGSGFDDVISVTFDGDDATLEGGSDTQLTLTSPPHVAGTVDVIVNGPGGASNPGEFTYIADPADDPVIDSLDPNSGPIAGDTVVTITGSGFTDVSEVTFDGTAGTDLTFVSDSEITVTTPPGSQEGAVDVVVTTPVGSSDPGDFTYTEDVDVDAPAITDLDPDNGTVDGGTTVTIEGTDLGDVTEVNIGGVTVTPTDVTDTTITFVTPPGDAGSVDVIVTGPGGNSNSLEYTYTADDNGGTDNGDTDGGDTDNGPLASTGSNAIHVVMIAMALALLGAGALMASRRRRHGVR